MVLKLKIIYFSGMQDYFFCEKKFETSIFFPIFLQNYWIVYAYNGAYANKKNQFLRHFHEIDDQLEEYV